MTKLLTSLLLTVLLATITYGQEAGAGHFLVEFDKFSPPTRDLITSFEGHIAEQFLASDVTGAEHFLGDYKGQKVILWFWSVESGVALEQIAPMKAIQETHPDVQIIAFAKEPKARVLEHLRTYPMDFDVIPNGEVFGQMAYGAELGSPRMFLIDEYGIIKVVLPEEAFVDNSRLAISLTSILGGM